MKTASMLYSSAAATGIALVLYACLAASAMPGPQFVSVTDSGSAEASYYTWVDQFDTFGLGKNVPIATGSVSRSP